MFYFRCFSRLALSALLLTGVASLSQAETGEDKASQTGWLEPKAGSQEKKLGARVDKVKKMTEQDVHRIEVSIPKTDKSIEEVVVIGKREGVEAPLLQKKRFEVINNPNTGRSGVVIYLGKQQDFALRINYYPGDAN